MDDLGRRCSVALTLLVGGLLAVAPLRAQALGADPVRLQEWLEKQSREQFRQATSGNPFQVLEDPANLRVLVVIMQRLARANGMPGYAKPIVIVRDIRNPAAVNAAVFPGGETIVWEGLLNLARRKAQSMAAEKTDTNMRLGRRAVQYHYQNLLAAVLGHELGHFTQKHALRSLQFIQKYKTNEKLHLMSVKFTQQNETEADDFGFITMQRAGFSPEYVPIFFEIVRSLGGSENPYISDHPLTSDRISRHASGDKRALYERLGRLERAFAAVETGGLEELKEGAVVLERELALQPENPALLLALARTYHRLWESTCTVDELLFKSSIAPVPFRDEMVLNKGAGRRAARKIPGNLAYYKRALGLYASAAGGDWVALSGQAVLLAYDAKQSEQSASLIKSILSSTKNLDVATHIQVINNAGIVFFLTGRPEDARAAFESAAGEFTSTLRQLNYVNPQALGELFSRNELLRQSSEWNTGFLFEAIFNLGQYYNQVGNSRDARTVWEAYVSKLDKDSVWSRYAGKVLNGPVAGPVYPDVAGIHIGMSPGAVIQAWGEPDLRSALGPDRQRWHFKKKGVVIDVAQVAMAGVRGILVGPDSLNIGIEGISVGDAREKVEKALGAPIVLSSAAVRYPGKGLVITYDENNTVSSMGLE